MGDYLVPIAADMPDIWLDHVDTPEARPGWREVIGRRWPDCRWALLSSVH